MQGESIGGILQAGVDKSGVEHGPQRAVADCPDLGGKSTLEQDRNRLPPDAFVAVVDRNERDCPVGVTDAADPVDNTSANSGETTSSLSSSVFEGTICSNGTISPEVGRRYRIRL